jgi:PhnB protein
MKHSLPTITPYLLYEDLDAAMVWLVDAFGFRERMKVPGPGGKATHAEMELGGNALVMMGHPGPLYKSPKRLGQLTQHLYVHVEDVDALFDRAVRAGAAVVEAPADQAYGERRCGVEDPEGHRWYFAEIIKTRE